MTNALTNPNTTGSADDAASRYVPEHDKTGGEHDYGQVLDDLSAASVHRNFDPYVDIDWDAPHMAITENDPRWSSPTRSTRSAGIPGTSSSRRASRSRSACGVRPMSRRSACSSSRC